MAEVYHNKTQRSNGLSCIWVDDGLDRLDGFYGFLSDEFSEITCCRYIDEALERVGERSYDLALVDIILPFAEGEPSLDLYPGLFFLDEIVSSPKEAAMVRNIAIFTVVEKGKFGARYAELKNKCDKKEIGLEYMSKIRFIAEDNAIFAEDLARFARRTG